MLVDCFVRLGSGGGVVVVIVVGVEHGSDAAREGVVSLPPGLGELAPRCDCHARSFGADRRGDCGAGAGERGCGGGVERACYGGAPVDCCAEDVEEEGFDAVERRV